MTPQQMAEVASRHSTKMARATLVACAERGADVPDMPPPEQYVIFADSPEWVEFKARESYYGAANGRGPLH